MTEVIVSTPEERLKARSYYEKRGWPFRCVCCDEDLDHSFAVHGARPRIYPIHYSCAMNDLVKHAQEIRGMR